MGRALGALLAAAAMLSAAGCSDSSAPPPEGARRKPRPRGDRAPRPARPRAPAPRPGDDTIGRLTGAATAPARPAKGPWADAKVGQFVTYRGPRGVKITHKVVKVAPERVVVETTTVVGQVSNTAKGEFPRVVAAGDGPRGAPEDARWTRETLRIGGKELPCRVAAWRRPAAGGTRVHKVWLCERVPGHLVRSERIEPDASEPTVTMELIDFGG